MEYVFFVLPVILIAFLIFRDFFREVFGKKIFSEEEKPEVFSLLNRFSYFNNLSTEGKDRFIERVLRFMHGKTFEGSMGLNVTREMEVLISASAIQLTFGLRDYDLSHYHTIRIFPEPFYFRLLEKYMKGGASQGGIIYFSWKDFLEGYANPLDKYNLGLHEMAHALKLDVEHGFHYDDKFGNYLDKWQEVALPEFERLQRGEHSFLRSYGGTNMHEFFAVCIEHFFEDPAGFCKNLPDLYNHLSYLLNQDPLNTFGDYRLEPNFVEKINNNKNLLPLPLKLRKNLKYVSWHWSFNLMLVGIFICPWTIIVMKSFFILSWPNLFLIILIFSLLGLLQWLYFKGKNLYAFRLFLGYAFISSGLCGTTLFLALNYFINIRDFTEKYRVKGFDVVYGSTSQSKNAVGYLVYLENNAYEEFPEVRTLGIEHAARMGTARYVTFNFGQGLFGLRHIKSTHIQ